MTILEQIVATRRRRLPEQQRQWPLERLQREAVPSDRDFAGALRATRPAMILECKKASPSKGLIRRDFDVRSVAAEYSGFASAISVLTEPDYFQGSLEYLGAVRKAAPQPVLCKDFVVDPWQVWAARWHGADAILLMLSVLDDDLYLALSRLAGELQMDVLTEISNAGELERAVRLGSAIVGINNRDLRDLSVDLEKTPRLAAQLPAEVLVISESGYETNQQLRDSSRHCHGFLVGSSLMAAEELRPAVKRLILGDHKVCGLTDCESAVAADLAGAVYGGVVFVPGSPRCLSPLRAREVLAPTGLVRVGVFRNQASGFVRDAVAGAGLDCVQLHGDEDPAAVASLRGELDDRVQVWKALGVGQLGRVEEYWKSGATRIVVDHQTAGQSGGTGGTFDWSLLPQAQRERLMVAGGLGPENVEAALRLRVGGLDFNSALETAPGRKSPQRIRGLFRKIREY